MAQANGLAGFIFNIANKMRGPYRPPQYRRVMLPMTVLRRLDCVLADNKPQVLKKYETLKAQGYKDQALTAQLHAVACPGRQQSLYNVSRFLDFNALLGDPDNLARNLVAYIKGFSPLAQALFGSEGFKFEPEIERLDKNNRLFLILKEFAAIDLHPDKVSNIDMGYVFEELVRRFNEQANEEAGDHFTPREVIRLMTHLLYTEDEEVYKPGIARTIYDPACGTGGMLSVSEEYIREHNPNAHLELFGQDFNEESWAVCCADMLIKDEPVDNIIRGDVLGDGETEDGHPDKRFHYMLANPPFGVEWKPEADIVKAEYDKLGFQGRFGPGLPRINDGALLFLLHMWSKRLPAPEDGGDGSKIAIVFNGSPLFTGEPGPSESNIRRWIIENDWLDAVVALPDQLFYNTGISTYIWIVTNRKRPERKGKVQLIDATRHYRKMKKSLGDKRNELSGAHIDDITRLYGGFEHDARAESALYWKPGEEPTDKIASKPISKIMDNRDFGTLKLTVERPLRLNFQLSAERIARLENETAFAKLATTKKRKDQAAMAAEIEAGEKQQQAIRDVLTGIANDRSYCNCDDFLAMLQPAFKRAQIKLPAPLKKAILSALSERDPQADMCTDTKGNPEPDPELRDTEIVPLPDDIALPLPMGYAKDADNSELVELVHAYCEDYLQREVLPHWPDAWVDYAKTKVGYEIPINRHFYIYQPPRPLEEIEADIKQLEREILEMLREAVV